MKSRQLLVGLGLVVILVGGMLLWKKSAPTPEISSGQAIQDPRTKGAVNAPIKIIEFSDFECPSCKYAQSVVEELMTANPGKISFTFKHFPLPHHAHREISHKSSECAAEQNKFWPFHDLLYGNQETWSKKADPTQLLVRYASEVGLDLDAFANCLADPAALKSVMKDYKEGTELKVRSTPTFFLNGERLAGGRELAEQGQKTIDRLLAGG